MPQPKPRPPPPEVDDWLGHICVPAEIGRDRVRMGEPQELGHCVGIDQVIGVDPGIHGFQSKGVDNPNPDHYGLNR